MTDNDEELRKLQIQQASAAANSTAFFARKAPKVHVYAEDETIPNASERDARQAIRRQARLAEVVQASIADRVREPQGGNFMKVSWDEFMRIKDDPEFQTLAQYQHKLYNYPDGRPRATPIRPLIEHELGMYRDKIVLLNSNPGDQFVGTLHQVAAQVTPTPPLATAVTEDAEIVEVDGDE